MSNYTNKNIWQCNLYARLMICEYHILKGGRSIPFLDVVLHHGECKASEIILGLAFLIQVYMERALSSDPWKVRLLS